MINDVRGVKLNNKMNNIETKLIKPSEEKKHTINQPKPSYTVKYNKYTERLKEWKTQRKNKYSPNSSTNNSKGKKEIVRYYIKNENGTYKPIKKEVIEKKLKNQTSTSKKTY
jgi:hypothetical protein